MPVQTNIYIDNVLTSMHTVYDMSVVMTRCSLASVDMMYILAYICLDIRYNS